MPGLNACPEVLTHQVFQKMFAVSELLNMDEETRSKVIEKMTTERDLRNQMAYARKEAIAEGHAEGRAEGRAEGQKEKSIEIARKLLAAGYPKDEVLELTGVKAEDL
jgi:predicted transposase/invertase (TIGR01784 family)